MTTTNLKDAIATYQTEMNKAQQKMRELEELMKDTQNQLRYETAKEKREEFDMMKKGGDCIKIDEYTYARETEDGEIDLYYQNAQGSLEVHTYEQRTYEQLLDAQIEDAYSERNWIWEMWVEEVQNHDTTCSLNEYTENMQPEWNEDEILRQAHQDYTIMPGKRSHELPEKMIEGCIWKEYESNIYQAI